MANQMHLSVVEASHLLDVSTHTVYRLIREKKLPTARERPILIRRSDVLKRLEAESRMKARLVERAKAS